MREGAGCGRKEEQTVSTRVAYAEEANPAANDPEAIADAVFGEDDLVDGESMYMLGLKYSTGADRPLDLVEAHKWFNLAALNGYADAKINRKELSEQMSSAEIANAQRAAREWLQSREAA